MLVIVHYPKSKDGQQELARRVAMVHAETVISLIRTLSCPTEQKLELLHTVKRIHKNEVEA